MCVARTLPSGQVDARANGSSAKYGGTTVKVLKPAKQNQRKLCKLFFRTTVKVLKPAKPTEALQGVGAPQ